MVFHLDWPYPLHCIPPFVTKRVVSTAGAQGNLVGMAAVSIAHEDGDNGGQRPPLGIGVAHEQANSPVAVVIVAASGGA